MADINKTAAEVADILMTVDNATNGGVNTLVTSANIDDIPSNKIEKPSTEGSNGQVLTTNGAGGVSWTDKLNSTELTEAVSDWLDENVDPTGAAVIVDSTLTISGAAADAKVTGDELGTLRSALNDISETTRNSFNGVSFLQNMTLDGEKVVNSAADGRTTFFCIVRFRNGDTNITASTVQVINATGRYSFTITPTGNGDNVTVLHNGSQITIRFIAPFNFVSGTAYTVSFNVEGYNPSVIGGLIISDIQIEQGSTATEYIPHLTAVDFAARKNGENNATEIDEVTEPTKNLFNGEYSAFNNMALNADGKISNTETDTRSGFFFTVKYLKNGTVVDYSDTTAIYYTGRYKQTLTATDNCDSILVLHNGGQRNLIFTVPFAVNNGETYTVSLSVDGVNPQTVGGLVLSNLQIEEGSTATPYIPSSFTAVDYIARSEINTNATEKDLNVLLMGDSIFGSDGEIALFLDSMVGSCTNGAFGGTRVSVRPYTSDNFRFFDGENLVTALCTQTWTDQDTAAETLASLYPWITERLATLKAVDMSKVDLLIMDWGTNDYTGGATIETITTAYGAVIDLLQETYPELRILITTPIWRYWGTEADNENGDTKVYNVSTLKEIALAIEEFMKNKRISVLNAYQNLPLSYKTALTYFDTNDKTHLNTFGNKVYAELLHGKMRSIY